MPSIKYYQFHKKNGCSEGTCYDGSREFIFPSSTSRIYPDEFLIAHILNKYLFRRLKDKAQAQFMVVVEPWRDLNDATTIVRQGDKNEAINSIIIEAAIQPDNKNKLLLVPFLYGYHHPGIAIDLRNKQALYIDPFGKNSDYQQVNKLICELQNKSIKYDYVKIKQQQADNTSCGPILTASMIKFIEEYLSSQQISSQGFEGRRSILATDRMFQMYVNNTTELDDGLGIDEIMLADTNLWETFLAEQAEQDVINDDISTQLYQIVEQQKHYINSLNLSQTELPQADKHKIDFIKQFQSKLTELIFLRQAKEEFFALIKQHENFFALGNKKYESIKLADLFFNEHFTRTLEVLLKINRDVAEENELPRVEQKKTVPQTLSWKLIAFKLSFALIRNRNLALLLLFLTIAGAIGFLVLTVLGLSLSPWLTIPCALLFLAVLGAIKIAHEYRLDRRENESKQLDFSYSDNENEHLLVHIHELEKNTEQSAVLSKKPSINKVEIQSGVTLSKNNPK